MDPVVSLVLGVVGGGVVGFIVATTTAKKAKDELTARLEKTKDEIERIRRETSDQVSALKSGQSDNEKALDTAKGKVKALEEAVAQAREQANQLSTSLSEAEAARARSQEQAASYQAARQQAEGKARQAQEQARAAQRNLQEVEGKVSALEEEKKKLEETANRRAKDLQALKSQVPASASGLDQSVQAYADASGSLPAILKVLLDEEQQQAVVIADANGIVVAAAGEGQELKEGMAAAARLVAGIGAQLVGMVPFEKVTGFQLQDGNAVITGRTFMCTGERISLSTYGPHEPTQRMLDGAVANLSAALE